MKCAAKPPQSYGHILISELIYILICLRTSFYQAPGLANHFGGRMQELLVNNLPVFSPTFFEMMLIWVEELFLGFEWSDFFCLVLIYLFI